jgi:hypothetical protein
MTTNISTVILGDEFDDLLRGKLVQQLKTMGAILKDHDWAVVGSQEIDTYLVTIENQELRIESETFVGLSITGASGLVQKITSAVKS